MNYRKKPVVIQALQWTGSNFDELLKFGPSGTFYLEPTTFGLRVQTLEGAMWASRGDFIIRGVKGEYYPCKPDIFAATYDTEA